MELPVLLPRQEIHRRLQFIFPEGTPHCSYCTRELAASTVLVALYVGAIEGANIFFGPKHVYRMTDKQAMRTDVVSRSNYASKIAALGFSRAADAGTVITRANRSEMRRCAKAW
jgi:hypothetical protein